jgi:hypothetical protein
MKSTAIGRSEMENASSGSMVESLFRGKGNRKNQGRAKEDTPPGKRKLRTTPHHVI